MPVSFAKPIHCHLVTLVLWDSRRPAPASYRYPAARAAWIGLVVALSFLARADLEAWVGAVQSWCCPKAARPERAHLAAARAPAEALPPDSGFQQFRQAADPLMAL